MHLSPAPPAPENQFEQLYQQQADPWDYKQAAEQAKYDHMLAAARRYHPHPGRVLEVACSLGHLTVRLAGYAPYVAAFDISPTAVEHTRRRCASLSTETRFDLSVRDALHTGYPPASFDVIFTGDVVHGAFDGGEQSSRLIRHILSLLAPGGVLVFTDYLSPSHQESYVRRIESQGGRVLERLYFHDRYCFRLRSLLKAVRGTRLARYLLESRRLYRVLAAWGKRQGPAGSKHFGVVCVSEAQP